VYRIRRLSHAYDALVAAADKICLPGDEPYTPRPTDLLWGALTPEGELAGYGALTPDGYLVRAGVLPKHRGHGLQRRLIQARVTAARRLRIPLLWTYTIPGNPASINNLIRCGFRAYDPEWAWVGDDVIYWWRWIS
jgi:GNAT superfamily N-acetyltransferase